MSVFGIVYCPMYEELEHVKGQFPNIEDLTEAYGFIAYRSKVGDFDLIITSKDEMGVSTANSTVRKIREDFDVSFIVCIGIAGALSDDVSLGDVCYTQDIIDINENQKVEGGKTKYQPKVYGSNNGIDTAIGIFAAHPSLSEIFENWAVEAEINCRNMLEGLPDSVVAGRRTKPIALKGPIVCGPVVADKALKTKLKSINRKVLAVETEAGGIYQSLDVGDRVEVIVVRGISDLADDTKKTTETVGKSQFRKIAARNAAHFLRMQLEHNFLLRKKLVGTSEPELPLSIPAKDPIEELVARQAEAINAALSELTPQYRAADKGYVLPVPRVRASGSEGSKKELDPLDILQITSAAVLEIPTTYPDKGLPWIYARHLLGQVYDGKVVVPIVVAGSDLRPPTHGLATEMERQLTGITTTQLVRPVIIIKDLSFAQERKAKLILEEAVSLGFPAFLVTSGSKTRYFDDDSSLSAWRHFSICSISFSSMVQFICSNFSLTGGEAEVLAVRLYDTFRRFNLSVHPSYFAGIPREMLSRLEDANHRAEFIDLAVTGFLSFMGAGDTKDINLKQRTRRLFLREIAYRISVEKESFTMSKLLDFIAEYSSFNDFGLNSLEFASSFINNGILHEDSGKVVFSVEFIQNYLVAEKLVENKVAAKKYFDDRSSDFDYSTFELYAEIGLSDDVRADVMSRLEADIASFEGDVRGGAYIEYLKGEGAGSYKSSGHSLTSGLIKPRLLTNLERSNDIQGKIHAVANDLLGKDSDVEAKQKVLDLSIEARQEVRTRAPRQPDEHARNRKSEILGNWIAAAVMLGAASEELPAQVKRKLASDLIRLGSLIIDDWMRERAEVDYEEIKSALLESLDENQDEQSAMELEGRTELVNMIVDFVEVSSISAPFSNILHMLTEHARNRVLYESVKTIKPKDVAEELLLSLWKLDLRESEGLADYKETLRSLSKDKFVRLMLTNHLVTRGYWYRSSEAGRRTYASAVEHTLKAINIQVPASAGVAADDGLEGI